MSDQARIAEILAVHFLEKCMRMSTSERTEWWQCLGCGWESEEFDLDDTEVRREIDRVKRAHLAAEIDKALGGLTQEHAIRSQAYDYTSMSGELDDLIDEIDLFSADHRIESRWVSEWKPVQP